MKNASKNSRKLEYPKPHREFIYSTFNAFVDRHPWVGQENIRPKSIAREMYESFRSFSDYVRDYGLERAEGLLLRHLNGVYNVLTQTVPDTAKDDEVREMELYLGEMIRQVDSSLLDEWKKMRDPCIRQKNQKKFGRRERLMLQRTLPGTQIFTALVRTRIFAFLRALSVADYESALETLDEDMPESADDAPETTENVIADPDTTSWTADRLRELHESYRKEHESIRLDPEARNLRHTYITPSDNGKTWNLVQVLVDPDENNDWSVEFEVDIAKSRADGKPVLYVRRIGPIE